MKRKGFVFKKDAFYHYLIYQGQGQFIRKQIVLKEKFLGEKQRFFINNDKKQKRVVSKKKEKMKKL